MEGTAFVQSYLLPPTKDYAQKVKRDLNYIQGSVNKFPDFFRMGTFIETLVPIEVIFFGGNVLVPFQQLLEGPMEVLLCERVNVFRHRLFHLLNCLIMTACELRE